MTYGTGNSSSSISSNVSRSANRSMIYSRSGKDGGAEGIVAGFSKGAVGVISVATCQYVSGMKEQTEDWQEKICHFED